MRGRLLAQQQTGEARSRRQGHLLGLEHLQLILKERWLRRSWAVEQGFWQVAVSGVTRFLWERCKAGGVGMRFLARPRKDLTNQEA